MKVTATTQDVIREKATTQKMLPAYSPAVERAKPTGRKPAIVTIVPVSIGAAVALQAKVAAAIRSSPSSIFTTIISIEMIASSTRRPSDMMSAPSVMRSKSRPVAIIKRNTTDSVSGTAAATTMPTRRPSERRLMATTTARAVKNFVMNSPIASEIALA